MFSDKKEEGRLPDLPPIKAPFDAGHEMGRDPEEALEIHSLPSFPDSPAHNRFSQAAIKDAVGTERKDDVLAIPGKGDGDVSVIEMKEWDPAEIPMGLGEAGGGGHQEKIAPPIESMEPMGRVEPPPELGLGERILPPPKPVTEPTNAGNLDVFVKLDKFHSAKKTLGEVRDKLEEVDELIKKIREIKLREEQEIASWEKDLTFARSRIQEITENIFEKVG